MNIRVGLVCALLPSLAIADERGEYVSLDRQGTDSAIGLAVSGHLSDAEGAGLAVRENVYGRLVAERGHGVYGQLSITQLFGDDASHNGAGGFEIGGLQVARTASADVILRLGLGLPIAMNDLEAGNANLYATLDRLHDAPLMALDLIWLRPGVAVRFGDAALFAQLDFGIDVHVAGEARGFMLHANAGCGTRQGPVTFTGELANWAISGEGLLWLHSLAGSVRYTAGRVQPYVAYTLTFIGTYGPGSVHAFTAGVQTAL